MPYTQHLAHVLQPEAESFINKNLQTLYTHTFKHYNQETAYMSDSFSVTSLFTSIQVTKILVILNNISIPKHCQTYWTLYNCNINILHIKDCYYKQVRGAPWSHYWPQQHLHELFVKKYVERFLLKLTCWLRLVDDGSNIWL